MYLPDGDILISARIAAYWVAGRRACYAGGSVHPAGRGRKSWFNRATRTTAFSRLQVPQRARSRPALRTSAFPRGATSAKGTKPSCASNVRFPSRRYFRKGHGAEERGARCMTA